MRVGTSLASTPGRLSKVYEDAHVHDISMLHVTPEISFSNGMRLHAVQCIAKIRLRDHLVIVFRSCDALALLWFVHSLSPKRRELTLCNTEQPERRFTGACTAQLCMVYT